MVSLVKEALAQIPAERRRQAHLFFSAHSIPESMAATSDYVRQIEETSSLVAERLGRGDWHIVYQSRSGAPGQPWLGPDIADAIATLPPGADLVVMPVGFVSDHMEVIYDLDHEARLAAERAGVNLVRAATPGTHPAFIAMIRELIRERTDEWPPRAVGNLAPPPAVCPETCCPGPPAANRHRQESPGQSILLLRKPVEFTLGQAVAARQRLQSIHARRAGRKHGRSSCSIPPASGAHGASARATMMVNSPSMAGRDARASATDKAVPSRNSSCTLVNSRATTTRRSPAIASISRNASTTRCGAS